MAGPANPKRFINEPGAVVQEAMDGLVWSTPNLGRLSMYPDIKVVFRTDWAKEGVALVSGGGAGHEPMHGGFVGKGMLTAAISGETFASPTVDAVFAALLQVTGPKGCLLIIKNYTGDRLNFTLAAQRARAPPYNLKVETVITNEDVATVAKRGVAGTLFVHKIAGAAAEQGKPLEEVKALAEAVISSSGSLSVTLSSCRRLKPEMIADDEMEVGIGIHGEPGLHTKKMATAKQIMAELVDGVVTHDRMKDAAGGYACLLNNLGGVTPIEMSLLVGELMKSDHGPKMKLLVGPAALCTSLDMNGVSLSLLKLSPDLEALLTADTPVAAWPKAVAPAFPEPVTIEIPGAFDGVAASADEAVSQALDKICAALVAAKGALDELDQKVGDGDCGTTMAAAAAAVQEAKAKLPMADPAATCKCLGALLGKVMGGSSGVLMSIACMGMASSFGQAAGGAAWDGNGPQAFMDGIKAMMQAGGASVGSRTMLDALVPAAEALIAGKGFAGAKAASAAGCEATKDMVPKAGRSENVPESAWRSCVDPGAQAVATVFAALG